MERAALWLQNLSRALQPIYFVWAVAKMILWLAVIPIIFAFFWPYIPKSWKPEWLVEFVQLMQFALSWLVVKWKLAILTIAVSMSTILLLLYLRLALRARKFRRAMPEVLRLANQSIRDHIRLRNSLAVPIAGTGAPARDDVKEVLPHLVSICRAVADAFKLLTGHNYHCTIKDFDPRSGAIVTRARDDHPYNHARRETDENRAQYHIHHNTAFRVIVEDSTKSFFCHNNLRVAARAGQFHNTTNGWQKFYNAAIVLPLSASEAANQISKEDCIGFITVDTLRGFFAEDLARRVLQQYALHVYDLMNLLGRSRSEAREGGHLGHA